MDSIFSWSPLPGDIFYADLTPAKGNEAGGIRPVLVLRPLLSKGVTIVAVMSSCNIHTRITREDVDFLDIRTIDATRRFVEYITKLSEDTMCDILPDFVYGMIRYQGE